MIRIFKRRRPTVRVQQLSREEIAELLIYRWHGLTPDEWTELPATDAHLIAKLRQLDPALLATITAKETK